MVEPNIASHWCLLLAAWHILRLDSAAFVHAGSRQSGTLDLELPYCAKWLLLAAYVASRNRPAVDRRLFDPSHRGRRRKGMHTHDRQVSFWHRLLYHMWTKASCVKGSERMHAPANG